jgi:inosose dehydratase
MANRRNFLKVAAIGITAANIPLNSFAISGNQKGEKFRFNLGVASYTLRKFSTEQALDMTLRCGVNRITFKSMHLPLDASDETIKNTVALCKQKGVQLYGCGVVTMKTKADVDQAFHYASMAGMNMIIGVPYPEVLSYVNEKVQEYNIRLAIHNHGPGDDLYPSAESAFNRIKNLDKRIGLCVDIGHTKRINRNPEKDVEDYFERVFDIHIKDVTAATAEGDTCIIGRGVINFVPFLKKLKELNYQGTLALEYEADENDPLPGMMESFGYVKGIMASI